MDAISFVLGVKSAQLRSSQLKDLVYRGRRLAKASIEGSEATRDQDEDEETDRDEDQGGESAKKAWVLAVYEDADKKEWFFQRTYVHRMLSCNNGSSDDSEQDLDFRGFGVPSQP